MAGWGAVSRCQLPVNRPVPTLEEHQRPADLVLAGLTDVQRGNPAEGDEVVARLDDLLQGAVDPGRRPRQARRPGRARPPAHPGELVHPGSGEGPAQGLLARAEDV